MPKLEISAFLLAVAGVSIPAGAQAHFVLQAPMNWAQQDGQGLPEKSAPCGQADPAPTPKAVPTNVVTPYAPGDTVTITIMETTPHPGHYRVVLSPTGQSGLPADPTVTPDSASACGTTTIQNPPVYPVLADGQLQHTGVMSGARSFTVKLPTDVTCTKCSLQVEEFMSNHGLNNPGGCWYHHCADISIQTGTGGAGGRGGAGGAAGAGMAGRGGAGGMAGRGGAGGAGGSAGATGTAGGSGTTGTAGGSGASGTAGTMGAAGASATAGSSGTTGAGGTGGTTAAGSAGSGGTTVTGRGGSSGTAGSGAGGSGVDAGPPGGGDSGGGCAVGEKNMSLSALLLVLVAFAGRRRPRRR